MRAMPADPSSELSQYRVTLFFGPEAVEGSPCTHACVFNVKRRSWKGGIQVAVNVTEGQIESSWAAVDFGRWLENALVDVPMQDRVSQASRARELFIQAVCWCKLDLVLQSGITQKNQCLAADTLPTPFEEVVTPRAEFITSHVASELDLLPRDISPF